jgi:putative peptide zinc metalloprotease protein
MTVSATSGPAAHALPRLRPDLKIELSPERGGGFPAVIVSDAVRGSYFRLGWPESGMLLLWNEAVTVDGLRERLAHTYGTVPAAEDIAAVASFAYTNQLTETDQGGTWQRYAAIHAAGQHGWLKTLMHGYLFFRVPLLHPEAMLQSLLPWLAFVYSRAFWLLLAAIALPAVYLATRQSSAITSAIQDIVRLEGVHVYAAAILGLKAIHELGHGLTTVRYGCRVPSMGIAMMLGMPVLYTDTSDSWRLAKRTERLAIVFAGVAAELIVATVAIALWPFLGEGLARQICFALATSSIVLSVSVNLNPFMRYDGYFALSDYLEIPNLQPRAFNLGIWKMRELLFDLRHPAPELLPARMQRILIAYATLTTVYRLGLYLGIVAVVYAMAGKAIGIILGLFEIVVFIALPFAREFGAWWQLRGEIVARRRVRWVIGATVSAGLMLLVPWQSTVEAPSVLVGGQEQAVHMPLAAKVSRLAATDGQVVAAGDILFSADAADLDQQAAKAALELRALEFQLSRSHTRDKERDERGVIESRLAKARDKLRSIDQQRGQLMIRAPFGGRVVDVDPEITAGIWINPKRQLARLVASDGVVVRGLVSDTDVGRIAVGSSAVFVPDDPGRARRTLVVRTIAPAGDGHLAEPVLADRYGGSVGAGDDHGEFRTRQGWFEVTFEDRSQPLVPAPDQLLRGVARVDATPSSPAMLIWRQIARVLVREQGF